MIEKNDQAVRKRLAPTTRRLVEDHQREERKLKARKMKAGFMDRLRLQQEVEMVEDAPEVIYPTHLLGRGNGLENQNIGGRK